VWRNISLWCNNRLWRNNQLHQYNETNVMHFSFNLLRIKGLYLFRALLAHPQELHRLMFVSVMRIWRQTSVRGSELDLTQFWCSHSRFSASEHSAVHAGADVLHRSYSFRTNHCPLIE
jgi:hypothetical protein